MPAAKILPWVFFLSGLSSLIFQVAWQRLLTVWYGVGPVSMTLIVSVYMLGLGLGAYLGGIIADRLSKRRRLFYLAVEACLAIFGFMSLSYLNWLGGLTAGCSIAFSLLCMTFFLLIPTIAMGMTLPLIVKIFSEIDSDFLHSVAYLYSLNTLGAFCGALLASYLLISFIGLDGAVYTASFIDLLLAGMIFLCRTQEPGQNTMLASSDPINNTDSKFKVWQSGLLVAITGFLAIGYEIVWLRLITMIVKPSAYAFSTILAVYLLGLFIGSAAVNVLSSSGKLKNHRSIYFWIQVAIAASVFVSIAAFYQLFKHSSGFASLVLASFCWNSPVFRIPDIFIWPALFELLPCILIGASFPLINYLGRIDKNSDGKTVGRLYLFNTIGNVLGGAITGFLLLPALATELSLQILVLAGFAFVLFLPGMKLPWRAGLMISLSVMTVTLMPAKGQLYGILFDRAINSKLASSGQSFEIELAEGVDGVVAAVHKQDFLQNYINGLTHGARPDYKYYRELVEAVSYHPQIEHALVIGFGSGSTTEALERMPGLKKITLVELNRTNLENLQKLEATRRILQDSRLEIIVDDARRYLLANTQKYDLITMDPLRPTEAYSNNIYSHEFFQLLKKRLKEKGVVLVWLGEQYLIPKTIASVFEHMRVYNFFCLAAAQPLELYPEQEKLAWSRFAGEELRLLKSFQTEFLYEREAILQDPKFKPYPINEDAKPESEYFLGVMYRFPKWRSL